MAILTVHIRADLEIPDDWELVEHPSGGQVLRVGDKFIGFFIEPVTATSDEADAVWSDEDEQLIETVLDAITEVETDLEMTYRH